MPCPPSRPFLDKMGTRRHTLRTTSSGLCCPTSPPQLSRNHFLSSTAYQQLSSQSPSSALRYSQSVFSRKWFHFSAGGSFRFLLILFIAVQIATQPYLAQSAHFPVTAQSTPTPRSAVKLLSPSSRTSTQTGARNSTPQAKIRTLTTKMRNPNPTSSPAHQPTISISALTSNPHPKTKIRHPIRASPQLKEEEQDSSNLVPAGKTPDTNSADISYAVTTSESTAAVNNLTLYFPDITLAGSIPSCGLKCFIDLVPHAGECLVKRLEGGGGGGGGDDADLDLGSRSESGRSECLCAAGEDEREFYSTVLRCVQARCNAEEAIETARGAWETCGQDGRSRRTLLWVALSAAIPALICVLVRLYSRWWAESKFEADDYIMMVVTLLFIPFEVIGIFAAKDAFGRDIWTVQASDLTISLKLFYVGGSFYFAILTLTKLSILVFYLRIFSTNNTFRRISYVVMLWVAFSGLVSVFLQIFQCTPIAFIWEGWKRGEFGPHECINVHMLGFTTAGVSIAQDLAIIIMPLPLLAKLNVPRRCRLGIMIMFSLGVFVLITSSVRLWSLYSFGESANPTWDYTDVIIWTGLEIAVSIIVTSLPAIRVLINRRLPGIFGPALGTSGAIWGPNGEYRGYADGTASTSSFGDTGTFVGSICSAGLPHALKRLSAISHVSSLKVERLTGSTWGFGYEEDVEKGEEVEDVGQCSHTIDFAGEKLSVEIRRMTGTETDYSHSRRTTFEGDNDALELTITRLSPRPNQRPLPYPPPPCAAPPERPRSHAPSVRPLPHPPQRPRSESSRPLPYPLGQSPTQMRPQGPRPLSPCQPDRVRLGTVRRSGLIEPLLSIAGVMSREMSNGSLPAQVPPLQDISTIPPAWRRMTIRKVEDGT